MTEEEISDALVSRVNQALRPALLNLDQAEFWDLNCHHSLSFPKVLDQQLFIVASLLVSSS